MSFEGNNVLCRFVTIFVYRNITR